MIICNDLNSVDKSIKTFEEMALLNLDFRFDRNITFRLLMRSKILTSSTQTHVIIICARYTVCCSSNATCTVIDLIARTLETRSEQQFVTASIFIKLVSLRHALIDENTDFGCTLQHRPRISAVRSDEEKDRQCICRWFRGYMPVSSHSWAFIGY